MPECRAAFRRPARRCRWRAPRRHAPHDPGNVVRCRPCSVLPPMRIGRPEIRAVTRTICLRHASSSGTGSDETGLRPWKARSLAPSACARRPQAVLPDGLFLRIEFNNIPADPFSRQTLLSCLRRKWLWARHSLGCSNLVDCYRVLLTLTVILCKFQAREPRALPVTRRSRRSMAVHPQTGRLMIFMICGKRLGAAPPMR